LNLPEEIKQIPGTTAHCYSLKIGDINVLVDAGMKSSGRKIIAYYDRMKSRPDVVLITHYHPDHIGGLAMIASRFSPAVYVPDLEMDVVKGKASVKPARSIISRMVAGIARAEPVNDVHPVSELHIEGLSPVATHGHTPGSTSYYVEKYRAIFVGDALLKKGSEITVNRAFTIDYDEALRSKEMILEMKPVWILPGHGSVIQFGNA
jgi:glyoxylase-like metal-dependent hydrolase (beta-lactamase superfamily II)